MKKITITPNGIIEENLTEDEIAQAKANELAWNNGAFDRALADLRAKRNKLLSDTDYLALADNELSEPMKAYRQQLRDLTEGLSTVEEVNAVVFPIKP